MAGKYIKAGAVVLCLFLVLVFIRVSYLQHTHFSLAETYFAKADYKPAMREYDLALHMYTPFSGTISKAAERLWAIGEMYEKQGRPDWAVMAYSSIRSSFYASRGLYDPGADWKIRCAEKIASLNVQMMIRDGALDPAGAAEEKKKFLYVMDVDRAPTTFRSIMVEIGFIGWIFSVVFIIMRGFDENGRLIAKRAASGAGGFIVFFAVWAYYLLRA